MAAFRYLIRFKDASGKILLGEAGAPRKAETLLGSSVRVYQGSAPWDPKLRLTERTAEVKELLCPLSESEVSVIHCVGLNYKAHLEESGLVPPHHPLVFTKLPDSLAGPLEDVVIDTDCKEIDYEGELCVVIGKSCKNLDKNLDDDPLNYVLGYTVGNDVSARDWQNQKLAGMQHGYSKSFDKFAPIGPSIVSKEVIPDPSRLHMTTKVNDELRQETGTDDLLFDVRAVIRHLSRGKTLRPGCVIMTGTPSGVGWFMKPSGLLKDNDVVEVEINQIGSIKNKMVFNK